VVINNKYPPAGVGKEKNSVFGDIISALGTVWSAAMCVDGDFEGCASAVGGIIKLAISDETVAKTPFVFWQVSNATK